MLWTFSEVSLALKVPDQLDREAAHLPRTPIFLTQVTTAPAGRWGLASLLEGFVVVCGVSGPLEPRPGPHTLDSRGPPEGH